MWQKSVKQYNSSSNKSR